MAHQHKTGHSVPFIHSFITFYCIRKKSTQNLTANTNTRNTDTTGTGKNS